MLYLYILISSYLVPETAWIRHFMRFNSKVFFPTEWSEAESLRPLLNHVADIPKIPEYFRRPLHGFIDGGVCREQARGVLSQNLYTEYYGTVNLNNLVKFLDLRIDEHAQWEIRRVAEACRDIAKELWPEAMKHFKK